MSDKETLQKIENYIIDFCKNSCKGCRNQKSKQCRIADIYRIIAEDKIKELLTVDMTHYEPYIDKTMSKEDIDTMRKEIEEYIVKERIKLIKEKCNQ